MQHLLIIKKFNDNNLIYDNYRSILLDDDDANILKTFIAENKPVPGFYKYVLTMDDEQKSQFSFESPSADLPEYAKYCSRSKRKSGHLKEYKNVIEQ